VLRRGTIFDATKVLRCEFPRGERGGPAKRAVRLKAVRVLMITNSWVASAQIDWFGGKSVGLVSYVRFKAELALGKEWLKRARNSWR
jgi:hypothetical protein